MDRQEEEGFFTYSIENLKSLNYYFEIHSDWARGNKEMLIISIILEQQITQTNEEIIKNLLKDFSKRLQSNEEIFMGFYINEKEDYEEHVELILK